jgi:hypothetical protein
VLHQAARGFPGVGVGPIDLHLHRNGTSSPRSRAAYFRAVQSGCSRHASKSASVRVDANAIHAIGLGPVSIIQNKERVASHP